ncbi:hypothetical protein SESBI_22105 [Sesbania bispinosa]|nr:hypothetical protein SESBI_22105 [Sesbania bispinosa]
MASAIAPPPQDRKPLSLFPFFYFFHLVRPVPVSCCDPYGSAPAAENDGDVDDGLEASAADGGQS